MANVTSRVKSHKSSSKRKHSTPKNAPANVNKDVEIVTVMKRPSEVKILTAEEKVQYILKSGHQLKDKIVKSTVPGGRIDKESLAITKQSVLTHTGKIKKKRVDALQLFNNILHSELMIADKGKKPVSNNKSNTNNNKVGIIDNNVPKTKSLKTGTISKRNGTKLTIIVKKRKREKRNGGQKFDKKSKSMVGKHSYPPNTPFVCDICQKTFATKPSVRKHIYGHLNLKLYKCKHCRRKFRYHLNMQIHVMNKHNGMNESLHHFPCDICDKTFLAKQDLKEHLSSHLHEQTKIKCLFCDENFSKHTKLTQHEKQHLVGGRYQCTVCKMSYGLRNHLSAHLKSHLKIKDYICQYCGKEFLRLNSMHRHVQVSHAGHTIQCPICKKKLKGHLTEHMRTHDQKRPHKCPECGQRFIQSTQLNVHRRSHTGARPYPCKICNRFFSYSNGLMLHIRRHTGEKPFPCAMCPISFSQLPHMKAHMRNIHGKEYAYKCNKCAAFFRLKIDLDSHVKNCTVGERELSFEEQIQASVQHEEIEVENVMSLSRMRYLLALLLTMIATKDKLKYLGFNKRLIDDLLIECLEAMGLVPCKDTTLTPFNRLKANIELLLGTVPKDQMEKLKNEKKSTEEMLEILTGEAKSEQ